MMRNLQEPLFVYLNNLHNFHLRVSYILRIENLAQFDIHFVDLPETDCDKIASYTPEAKPLKRILKLVCNTSSLSSQNYSFFALTICRANFFIWASYIASSPPVLIAMIEIRASKSNSNKSTTQAMK